MMTHDGRLSIDPKSRVDFMEEAAPTMEGLNPTSAPLAAAMSKQKPKFWFRSAIRVFMAVTVGHLISIIQGSGTPYVSCRYREEQSAGLTYACRRVSHGRH
jgi:hypothetical protein